MNKQINKFHMFEYHICISFIVYSMLNVQEKIDIL